MTDFLIKSTISLLALLLFYHLILEKEKMHRFNRFYLLFGIAFSFALPFITIEIIGETIAPIQQTYTYMAQENLKVTEIKETIDYKPIILWSLYGLVTSMLLFRYIRNILKIVSNIKSNPIVEYKNAKLILLEEQTPPHTFWNYIFLNKADYQNRKINKQLYTHELIHVTQKHTLDVLFVEALKTVFWFNPLFIFYKKAIQLNHEFLADEKVVKAYNDIPFYQNLLLAHANTNPTFALTSNINYSITKKRFIMMTRNTSPSRALLKKGIIIPLLTTLVFSLCTKVVAQENNKKSVAKRDTVNPYKNVYITSVYYENTTFKIKDEKGKVIAKKKYSDLTSKEKKLVPQKVIKNYDKNPMSEKEIVETIKKDAGPKTFIVDEFDPKNIKPKKENPDAIYSIAELTENPEYPGGIQSFYAFVGKNFTKPKTPDDVKLNGKIYITFVVEPDGNLSNFKTVRDIGHGTGEEAVRVLKLSPQWTPGKVNGEPVRTLYSLPITMQAAN